MNMIDKVLTLASAGYTKDEISRILSVDEQKPEQKPEEKPEQKPEEKPEQKPEQKPEHKPFGMDALNARLDKLIARMEQDAINRSNQPPKETTDDILASIIRPKRKE